MAVSAVCSRLLQTLILGTYSLAHTVQSLWARCHWNWQRCRCCGHKAQLPPPQQIERLRLRFVTTSSADRNRHNWPHIRPLTRFVLRVLAAGRTSSRSCLSTSQ